MLQCHSLTLSFAFISQHVCDIFTKTTKTAIFNLPYYVLLLISIIHKSLNIGKSQKLYFNIHTLAWTTLTGFFLFQSVSSEGQSKQPKDVCSLSLSHAENQTLSDSTSKYTYLHESKLNWKTFFLIKRLVRWGCFYKYRPRLFLMPEQHQYIHFPWIHI